MIRSTDSYTSRKGVAYSIVRPGGLNDKWPPGARPIFSQGDVAVGRINRKDVASVLVDVLSTQEALGKTFEVIGLAGYPPAGSIAPALSKLKKDSIGITEEEIQSAYLMLHHQHYHCGEHRCLLFVVSCRSPATLSLFVIWFTDRVPLSTYEQYLLVLVRTSF